MSLDELKTKVKEGIWQLFDTGLPLMAAWKVLIEEKPVHWFRQVLMGSAALVS
ncbi:hypothetical protein [Vibrio vulnificus]|uniref:hypothetical protein n=1 Tax=Vibrio vulnificus TaxID=672 RepID=UPI003C1300B0